MVWGDGTKSNPKPCGSPFLISFYWEGSCGWLMSVVGPWRGLSFVGPEGGSFLSFSNY